MFYKILISIGMMFVWGFMLPVFTAMAFQQSPQYAYLAIPDEGDPQVLVVSSDNPSEAILQQHLSIPDDRLPPSQISLSPNGDWMALPLASSVSGGDPMLIRLVNLASEEVRDIGIGFPVITSFNVLMAQQNIVWSPSGDYLALNLMLTGGDETDSEVFIYSLVENRLVNITDDQNNQAHVAWSSDSTRIVTRRDDCSSISQNNFCSHLLEIINVIDGSRTLSPQLPNPSLGSVLFDASACELGWSPDNSTLSFVSSCTDGFQVPRSVYVWSLETNAFSEIVSFTPQATEQSIPDFQEWYIPFWYDSQTILIGSTYQLSPAPVTTQTLLYNVIENSTTVLMQEMVQELAINPVTSQIATRTLNPSAITEEDSSGVSIDVATIDPANAISLDDTSVSNPPPNGCNLTWSQDGAFLAYSITASSSCQDPVVAGLMFVNGANGVSQQHIPVLENGTTPASTLPIGWITE